MNSLISIITMLVFIFLFKSAITLYDRFANYQDRKLKFTIDIKKESINKMSQLEFEGFCKWLFEGTDEYSNIELASSITDAEFTMVATTLTNKKIFIDCKRFSNLNPTEDFIIERIACQNLAGAMIANNITDGIIITTGDIHENALEYLRDLKNCADIDIKIISMIDIVKMLENRVDNTNYSTNVII